MMKTSTQSAGLAARIRTILRPGAMYLLCAGSFVLLRPYIGIVHDARLYIGYALAAVDPNGIGLDSLFTHDGQSSFSIYPQLLRILVSLVGPSQAAIASTAAGLSVWLAAFLFFTRRLIGPLLSTKAFLAVATLSLALPAYYGGTTVLSFAEPFATPRVFAEASSLAALGWVMDGRWSRATLALLAGMFLHPLMTLPAAITAIWMSLARPKFREAFLAVGAVGCCVLCLAPLVGTSGGFVTARFDAEWLRILDEKYSLVFLRHWMSLDFARIALHLATIALSWRILSASARIVVGGVVLVASGGLLLSFVGADLMSSVFVAQGQAWRGLWLLALVSSVSLGRLAFEVFSPSRETDTRSIDARWVAGVYLLFAAWFAIRVGSGAAVLAGLAVVLTQLHRIVPSLTLPRGGESILGGLVLVFILCVTATECWVVASLVRSAPEPMTLMIWQTAIFSGVPALVVILAAVYAMRFGVGEWPTHGLVAVSTLSFATSLALADSRQPYQRLIERSLDGQLGRRTSESRSPIAWSGGDLEPWAIEGAPGWGSVPQGISVVFSRELALLWRSRWDLLEVTGMRAPIRADTTRDAWMPHVDSAAILELCASKDGPGFVVVPSQSLHGVTGTVKRLPVPKFVVPRKHGGRWARIDSVSRVNCALFNSSAGTTTSSRNGTQINVPMP